MKYSEEEKIKLIRQDLEDDAIAAENQVKRGEFYPELGVTAESLLAYARECREKLNKNFTSIEFIYGTT